MSAGVCVCCVLFVCVRLCVSVGVDVPVPVHVLACMKVWMCTYTNIYALTHSCIIRAYMVS